MMSPTTTRSATTEAVGFGARLRGLLLAPDFLVALPVGVGLGALPTFVPSLVGNGFTFMVTLSAISAGVAALVLTPMAILLSTMSSALKSMLQRLPGGVGESVVPFAQVAVVAVVACVASLIVAILTPLAGGTYPGVIWLCAALPIFFFLWALLGCVQVTVYLIHMIQTAHQAEELQQRADWARQRRAKGQ